MEHHIKQTHFSQKTLDDLGWESLLAYLEKHCSTEKGQMLTRALMPFATLLEAQGRAEAISEAKELLIQGEPLSLGGIVNLDPWLLRVSEGDILEGPEFVVIAQTLRQGSRLHQFIRTNAEKLPRLSSVIEAYVDRADLVAMIERTFDERGEVKDSASPKLQGLRKKLQSTQQDITKKAHHLLEQPSLSSVWQEQYITQREGRYVLPVRAEARVGLRGIVQDTSASGATVFMEPEALIELNNQLRLAQLELAAETHRILQELSHRLSKDVPELTKNLQILAELDVIHAAAKFSSQLDAAPLVLLPISSHKEILPSGSFHEKGSFAHQDSSEKGLALKNARHPLLLLGGTEVVANDIFLDQGQALILSGPNAGGKTVALKITGLFLLMARAGLHCPVDEDSTMPWFEKVFTDIGDDQSLEKNVSTFSAHIRNLCWFLQSAGPETLILLDEIAVGTDPEQGAALAQSIIEAFVAKEATLLVTTHYPSLKLLASENDKFVNASVGYDLERLQPTYRLHLGLPGPSETLPVAKKLGLPEEIIQRTYQLVQSERIGVEFLLRELTAQKEQLKEASHHVENLKRQAEEKTALFNALVQEAQLEVKKQRKKAHDQAVSTLQEARRQLEEVRSEMKRKKMTSETNPEELSLAKKTLENLSSQIYELTPRKDIPLEKKISTSALTKGQEVYIASLNKKGTLLTTPERGKVWIMAGGLKLQVGLDDLYESNSNILGAGAKGAPSTKSPSGTTRGSLNSPNAFSSPIQEVSVAPVVVRTSGNTLDLRGERVDDAIQKTEDFLDEALLNREAAIYVIHGHGTGALREAIRSHFLRHAQVKELSSASVQEGGEGVTILYLR